MNPLEALIQQGRAESSAAFAGVPWVHYLTFVALGTSVLYFTLELDRAAQRKGGRVYRAVRS